MRRRKLSLALGGLAVAATATVISTTSPATADRRPDRPIVDEPLVIGHRGASGYRPEHTLASYELAIAQGADFVEPDLVSTSDGVLVARHENEIGGTTDVAAHPEFADRRTTKTIDGVPLTGWFTEDFTLAELKTLRAVERIPGPGRPTPRSTGSSRCPRCRRSSTWWPRSTPAGAGGTRSASTPRPSTRPTSTRSACRSRSRSWRPCTPTATTGPTTPVFVQSFETANLRDLDDMTRVRLVQLYGGSGRPYDFTVSGDTRTYADLATPAGLAEVATYADGIGPTKGMVVPVAADGTLGAPTALVADAHRQDLTVHIYTMRNENSFVPPALRTSADPNQRGQVEAEYAAMWAAGIDGLFSDNPDTAVATRAAHLARR